MKTYCKHNLLHDREFCFEMVKAAFHRKWKRKNYQRAIAWYCRIPLGEVRRIVREGRKAELEYGLYAIADEFQKELRERKFNFPEIMYRSRIDGLSGKVRVIGIMSVKQQCFEHIIVGALMDLFNAKIVEHQYASMEKRGQVAGMKKIRKWIRSDNWSERCARKYGSSYTKKCTKYVKLDVTKCFPSITSIVVMRFLRRDIHKNEELLWCVEEILKTHEAGGRGLVIGSLLSQFLCNYLMSYAYRHVMNLCKERRGKSVRLVTHALTFMDDILLVGNDRRNLKMAARSLIKFVKTELGLTIKENWHVKNIDKEPIDMMGYVIHADGHVTIRSRIFLRARRSYARAHRRTMTVEGAKRLMAYFGCFKHTNSHKVSEALEVSKIGRMARRLIRNYDKQEGRTHAQFNPVYGRARPCRVGA